MKNTILKITSLLLIFYNCSKDETIKQTIEENIKQKENCKISEIRFAFTIIEYKCNTNGLNLINYYNNLNVSSYYVKKITSDSLAIGLILSDLYQDIPIFTAK